MLNMFVNGKYCFAYTWILDLLLKRKQTLNQQKYYHRDNSEPQVLWHLEAIAFSNKFKFN